MSRFLGSLFVKRKNGFYGYAVPQNHDGVRRLSSAQQYDQPQRYTTDSALPAIWRYNRIGEDAHGRLAEKDERRIRDGGSHSHYITTITSTVWCTTAAGNRALHCWKVVTFMTRWTVALRSWCGKAGVSA